MFKSLKRAFITLMALSLLVSNAGVVFAQTFNDVPTDAWYYNYVEQLTNAGVFDVTDNFRPNDALNRAELVKIVITAVDGLASYKAPATPTFDDVATSAWFYDYVEAAVQLGIVSGYTDAKGSLTGKFGPGDTVNRAAATKILVNAFKVPTTTTPASIFPDVTSGAWFYDYVVTAYNQSILDGYSNGKFGPADPVTRAQVAKLVVNS
ncbi:MAG TPA: S-layer homology domain-containing protein, partial [Methylococcales bacterium]